MSDFKYRNVKDQEQSNTQMLGHSFESESVQGFAQIWFYEKSAHESNSSLTLDLGIPLMQLRLTLRVSEC